jgi:hypothetical protein
MIKQTFYTGYNNEIVSKVIYSRSQKLNSIRISSEIKDHSHFYELWFEFIATSGQFIPSDRITIDCTELCDERGYVVKSSVTKKFKTILDEQLAKKIQ